ncbi:hypothetical protein Mp_4g23400 [Marchantia polymorpha subsp. ruderalis]|uniref:HAT C-terminal dimerisation domain-containing protein n=2 Tax=Marchantia polymorpha TaxID=3197 RepID=A0AAF6BCY7_MARPO|nr:hypothetical protein MARPO_0020s0103 [Marchantia polymorpha]BBN09871.1 hypothetical protein Mp_4g23400 [Marchantia polymorpha subsp. ruderalis]|eukprot:PTQ44448.1 hypothetical protein MARPO_0020s0103 [Marchantia polymorpha]
MVDLCKTTHIILAHKNFNGKNSNMTDSSHNTGRFDGVMDQDEESENGELAVLPLSSLGVSSNDRHIEKRKRTCWIRPYFVSVPGSNRLACIASKYCSRNYSTTSATSNLHLRNSHGITHESLEDALPGDPSQTTFTKSGSYLEVHYVLDDETKSKIMTSVVDWVIDMKQSFSSVESVSFKQMTNALNRFWPGCSRQNLTRAMSDEMKTATKYFYFPPPHDQWSTMSFILESLVSANVHKKNIATTTHNASKMIPAFQNLRDELNNKFAVNLDYRWHLCCVCHIMHRAVIDSKAIFKPKVEKLRAMLKAIRLSSRMCANIKKVQVLLGAQEHERKDVPGLDVKNSKLVTLTSIEWSVLKCFKDFLAPAYEITILSSRQYATLSNQPLVFESLKTHCQDIINGTINFGFIAPESKNAARALMVKLEKYYEHLTGSLPITRSMLIVARRARALVFEFDSDRDDVSKEITNFLQFTKIGDESCDDARFPRLSLVARNTLMCMGSSMPSESAFSENGAIVTAERYHLCDTSIKTTMKF